MNEIAKRQEVERMPERPASILDVIEKIASNPEIDIDRMQALLRLRAEEEDRIRRLEREDRAEEAKRAWLRALSQAQAEIGPIVRNKKNTHTNSEYEDLAAIERAAMPVLTRLGFSVTSDAVEGAPEGCLRMQMELGHVDGHVKAYTGDFPLDKAGSQGKANKTDIQAQGSTETYARRYLMRRALNLATTSDSDGNAAQVSAPISAEQFIKLRDRVEALGVEPKFLARFKITTLEELPAARFADAMAVLDDTEKARRAKTDA